MKQKANKITNNTTWNTGPSCSKLKVVNDPGGDSAYERGGDARRLA